MKNTAGIKEITEPAIKNGLHTLPIFLVNSPRISGSFELSLILAPLFA